MVDWVVGMTSPSRGVVEGVDCRAIAEGCRESPDQLGSMLAEKEDERKKAKSAEADMATEQGGRGPVWKVELADIDDRAELGEDGRMPPKLGDVRCV
jgi:hypothetical protein